MTQSVMRESGSMIDVGRRDNAASETDGKGQGRGASVRDDDRIPESPCTEKRTKECLICHAVCFDDMDVCFGCLHEFSRDAPVSVNSVSVPSVSLSEKEREERHRSARDSPRRFAYQEQRLSIDEGRELQIRIGIRVSDISDTTRSL